MHLLRLESAGKRVKRRCRGMVEKRKMGENGCPLQCLDRGANPRGGEARGETFGYPLFVMEKLGGEKMKKGYMMAPIVILAVLVLAAFSTPASALAIKELNTTINGTIAGDVYVGGGEGDGTTYTQNFSVPNGTILWARLYVHVWASGQSNGWLNITFYNGTGCTQNNQYLSFNYDGSNNNETQGYYVGCGYGTYWKYWNVTDIVNNGYNNVTASTSGFDVGEVNGIALVTVYEDGGEQATYWVNDGYVHLGTAYSCAVTSNTTWFNGTVNKAQNATLWTIYLTGDSVSDYLYFNGHELSSNAADGGGSTPDKTWSAEQYFDIDSWHIDKNWLDPNPSTNNVTFGNVSESSLRAVVAVLINREPKPDLNVTKIETLVEREGMMPFELVANHTYTITATIKNKGTANATDFNVTMHENGALRNDTYIPILVKGEEGVVQFNWTPNATGTYALTVTADAYNDAIEKDETNNASTKNVAVLDDTGPADLVIHPDDITFLPAYGWHTANNNTKIIVKVTNSGTADAGNTSIPFKVQLIVDGSTVENKTTWLMAKSYRYVTFERYLAAGSHTVEVRLDPDGNVTESSTTNNNAVKSLNVVSCRIFDTHHYGDISSYTGPLSGNSPVNMFDVTKLAPENTTVVDLLKSVAQVELGGSTPVGSVDGLEENDTTHYYWYPFVNGIPVYWVPGSNWSKYQLQGGDVVHWDILRYVNTKKAPTDFKPRPIMDYPEPFLHGYNGTVWNITIVYPSGDGSYYDIADRIKDKLNDTVPDARINIRTNATLTDTEKQNNHLILLGTPTENNITADVNANHTEVGMPVYYNTSTGNFVDDSTDESLGEGAVIVEACDNPFNNANINDTWKDENQTIWIATGKTSEFAKEAAEWLINRTCLLKKGSELDDKGFWLVQFKCGDVTGDGNILMNDFTRLQWYVGKIPGYTLASKWAGDVTGDGNILMNDVTRLQWYVGKIPGTNLNCKSC